MEAHEVLGDAVLELGVEWTKYKRDFELAGRYTVQQMDQMARSTAGFQMSIDRLGAGLRAFTGGQTEMATVTRGVRDLIDAYGLLKGATERYNVASLNAAKTAKDFAVAIESQRSSLGKATEAFVTYTNAMKELHGRAAEYKDDLADQAQGIRDVNTALGETIQLQTRLRALGPMSTPAQRAEVRRDPAYQMLVRTESVRPGEGVANPLTADIADRLVRSINEARGADFTKLTAKLEQIRLEAARGMGVSGLAPRRGQAALTEGGGVGPEFFRNLGRDMEKAMAPIREARAAGINVTQLLNESIIESKTTAKAVKDSTDSLRSFVAEAVDRVSAESATPAIAAAVAAAAETKIADQVERIASSTGPVADAYERFNNLIRQGGPLSDLAVAFQRQAEMRIGAPGSLERPGMLERQLETFVGSLRDTLKEAEVGHRPSAQAAAREAREAVEGEARGQVKPAEQDIIELHRRQLEEAEAFYKEILGTQAPDTPTWFKGAKGGTNMITPDNALPVAIVAASQSGLGPRAQQFEAQGGRVVQAPGGVETAVPTGQPTPGGQEMVQRVPSRAEILQATNEQARLLGSLPSRFPGGEQGLAPFASAYSRGMTPSAYRQITGGELAPRPARAVPSGEQLGRGNIYAYYDQMIGTRGGPNQQGQLTPEEYDPFSGRTLSHFGQRPQTIYPVREAAPITAPTAVQVAALMASAAVRQAMADELARAEQLQITAGGGGRKPPGLPPGYSMAGGGPDPFNEWNKRMDALIRLFQSSGATAQQIAEMQAAMPTPRALRPGYRTRSEAEQLVLPPGLERGAGPFGANYPELRVFIENTDLLAERIAEMNIARIKEWLRSAEGAGTMGMTAGQFERYISASRQYTPAQMYNPPAQRFVMPGRGETPGTTRQDIWDYIMAQQQLGTGRMQALPESRQLPPGYGDLRGARGQTFMGIPRGPEGPQPGYTAYGGRGGEIVPYSQQDPYRHIVETLLTAMALQAENRARMAGGGPTAFPQGLMHQLLAAQMMHEGAGPGLPRPSAYTRPEGPAPFAYTYADAQAAARAARRVGRPGQLALPPAGGTGGGAVPPTAEELRAQAIADQQQRVAAARAKEAADRAFYDSLGLAFTPPGGGGGGGGGGRTIGGMGPGDFGRRIAGFGGGTRIPIPFLGGLGIPGAAFGSLGSLAGLGPEHLLMTAGAVGGSAVMGAAGAGTLAAGTLAQTAVGGGADVAVLKSTISDTQAIAKNYQAVNTAVETYGKNSQQAILATSTLNQQMRDLGQTQKGQPFAPGVAAELALAKSVDNMDKLWDKSTQNARVQAVKLLEQGVGLGTAYIPLVAKAAQQNLSIINTAIKPLFSWLEGPQGMGIFNDLENHFKKNLPTAVHAFSQALEVILRFLDAASSHTGGLTRTLDGFFTKLNDRSPTYFADLVNRLVGDFRLWENLIKILGSDIHALFAQDAGTGNAVVTTLTQMLTKLGDWEKSTRGSGQLRNLFQVHKDEAIALMGAVESLGKAFGRFYLTAAPGLTQVMTHLVTLFGTALDDLLKLSPQIGTMVGAMLLMQKLGVLVPIFKALGGAMRTTAEAETVLKLEGGGTISIPGAKGGGGGAAGLLSTLFGGGKGKAAAGGEKALAMDMSLLAGGGATAKEAESFLSKLRGGAGGAAIAGFGGYLAGTAAQKPLGLRTGGTASAVGGAAGTVGGALGAALLTETGPIGMMVGAGLGSAIGSTLGPTVGHFFGNLFGIKSGEDYGKKWTEGFNKALPGMQTAVANVVGPRAARTMAENITSVTHNLVGLRSRIQGERANLYASRGPGDQVNAAELQQREDQINKDNAKLAGLEYRKGSEVGLQWVAGMQNVKVPTEFAFIENTRTTLQHLGNPMMRAAAAEHMLEYTKTLEDKKQLPKTAVRDMIHDMELNFPGLTSYLQKAGEDSDRALADKMKMAHTQNQLHSTLQNIESEFGLNWQNPDVSGKNWLANTSKYADDLQVVISTTTGKAKRDAIEAFRQLRVGTGQHLAAMVSQSVDQTAKMKTAIVGGSATTEQQAGKNWLKLSGDIASAMSSGTVSTAEGQKLIAQALNQTLRAFGEKPLAVATIKSATPAQLQAVASGSVTSGALASRTAVGGLIQVGVAGDHGSDVIPMNVGGTPIIVGSGEQVAVFNASQQQVMNNRLADYGGLGGFFNTVNTPHYQHAEGGFVPQRFQSGGVVKQVNDFFTQAGFDKIAIAGILGNAMQESTLNPNAPGGGLWQQISNFGSGTGGTLLHQMQTMLPQIEHLKGALNAARTPGDAAVIFEKGFEIAGIPALANRIMYANQAFAGKLGAGLTGGMGAAPMLRPPTVIGTGTVADITRGALKQMTDAANTYISSQSGTMGGPGGAVPNFPLPGGPVPAQVRRAYDVAMSQLGKPYILGGYGTNAAGLDCSGYVSTVLNVAGFDPAGHLLTGGLKTWGDQGPGKWITVGVLGADSGPTGHTMMEIDGHFFESGGHSSAGPHVDSTWSSPFTWWRHPHGFATGGMVGDPAHQLTLEQFNKLKAHRSNYARGGFVEGFQGGGQPRASAAKVPPYEHGAPPHRGPSHAPGQAKTRKTTGSKGSGHTIKHKPYHPPHLPPQKKLNIVGPLPHDIYDPLNRINADEGKISDQQNILNILTGREGLYPVSSIITDADGNQIVNWGGDPGVPVNFPPPTDSAGMIDPSTNQWAYGIDVRLGEIGPVGALGQFPGPIFPTVTPTGLRPDQHSELGIDEQILYWYNDEWIQAKKAMGPAQTHLRQLKPEVGWYDNQGNFQPGLLQLQINRLQNDKAFLAPEKSNAEIDLTTKYNHLKDKVRNTYHKKRLSSQMLRTASIDAITNEMSRSDAALATMPTSWLRHGSPISAKAAQSAWHQQHAWEQSAVTQRGTAERLAVDDAAMKQYYNEALDQSMALRALDDQMSIERKKMNIFWAQRRQDMKTKIDTLTTKFSGAKTFLDALTGSTAGQSNEQQGGILGQLHAYLDRYGSLQTGSIGTMQQVTIPGLLNEIKTLKGTTPTTTQAQDNAAADAANLAALQAQQMTIQAETIASQNAAFKTLTEAINSLPAYGGSFQEGGIVPGPLGEPRTVIAHGGETVTPPGGGSGGGSSQMLIRMEDNRTRIWMDGVEQQVQMSTGTAARHARRGLPGRGGGLLS